MHLNTEHNKTQRDTTQRNPMQHNAMQSAENNTTQRTNNMQHDPYPESDDCKSAEIEGNNAKKKAESNTNSTKSDWQRAGGS